MLATHGGNSTTFGTAPLGRGRVVVAEAVLPQASEEHEHWFGLNPYVISITDQQVLLDAMSWADGRPGPLIAPGAQTGPASCAGERAVVVRLPGRVQGRPVRGGTVTVGGRRTPVQRVRGRHVALIDLASRSGRTVAVRVTSRAKGGRRSTQVRRLRTCSAGPEPR